jgi:hypothetical protein
MMRVAYRKFTLRSATDAGGLSPLHFAAEDSRSSPAIHPAALSAKASLPTQRYPESPFAPLILLLRSGSRACFPHSRRARNV